MMAVCIYDACEPEHRLVARELEGRWNHQLRLLADLEAEYRREQDRGLAPLTADEREALGRLVGDVPALWAAPETTMADRKRLVRCLVREVVLLRDDRARATGGLSTVRIGWRSGAWSELRVRRPSSGEAARDPRWVRLTAEDLARLDGTLAAHGDGRWRIREAQRTLGLSQRELYQRVRDGRLIAYRARGGEHWEWRVSPTDHQPSHLLPRPAGVHAQRKDMH